MTPIFSAAVRKLNDQSIPADIASNSDERSIIRSYAIKAC
jgi:hypothetical protein